MRRTPILGFKGPLTHCSAEHIRKLDARLRQRLMSTGLAYIRTAAAALLFAMLLGASETRSQVLVAEEFLQKGDYRSAIEILNRAVRDAPRGDPEVYLMLAISKLNLEDKTGAIQAAEQGLQLFPDSERIANYYTSLLPTVLASAQVVKRLEARLVDIPHSAILGKAFGKALLAQDKNDPRIESLLSSAATALPRDPEAQFLYGEWACLHQHEDVCIVS